MPPQISYKKNKDDFDQRKRKYKNRLRESDAYRKTQTSRLKPSQKQKVRSALSEEKCKKIPDAGGSTRTETQNPQTLSFTESKGLSCFERGKMQKIPDAGGSTRTEVRESLGLPEFFVFLPIKGFQP